MLLHFLFVVKNVLQLDIKKYLHLDLFNDRQVRDTPFILVLRVSMVYITFVNYISLLTPPPLVITEGDCLQVLRYRDCIDWCPKYNTGSELLLRVRVPS